MRYLFLTRGESLATQLKETIMTGKRLKLIAVGVFVGCALGLIGVRVARATPGHGISTTIIAGPSLLDETHVVNQTPDHGTMIKTRGQSDVYVVFNRIAPGGDTGWHSHPGPSVVSVVSGEASELRGDSPDVTVHQAGTAFVDEGGDHSHNIVNRGDTDLVLVAFQILPQGATRRIDEPAP